MAQGQIRLSIFNVAVCVQSGWGRKRGREIQTNKLFFFTLHLSASLPPSLMNYQCFEVISMQGPDSKLGSQPLSLQTHELAISHASSCCTLSTRVPCWGTWVCILIRFSLETRTKNSDFKGSTDGFCRCVSINPWGAMHVWNHLFPPLCLQPCTPPKMFCANIQAHVPAKSCGYSAAIQ